MIITYPLNGITYDAQDAETYLCSRESGVFSDDDHFKATLTNSREITISAGLAWIKDKKFAAGCSRDVIQQGADLLDCELDVLLERTLCAMQARETEIETLCSA